MPERAQAEQSDRVLVEAETAEAGAEACKRGRGYAATQRLGAPQLIPDTGYRIHDARYSSCYTDGSHFQRNGV
jgi:hypothetical protein